MLLYLEFLIIDFCNNLMRYVLLKPPFFPGGVYSVVTIVRNTVL